MNGHALNQRAHTQISSPIPVAPQPLGCLAVRRLLTLGSLILLLAPPAGAQALTRAQANAVALRALGPAALHREVILFGLPRPLGASAVVFEAGVGPSNLARAKTVRNGLSLTTTAPVDAHPVGRRAWLFWEDLAPQALFEHPSVLLLVDDRTGRVLRRQQEAWYPLIDRRTPPFLRSAKAYASSRNHVFTRWATARRSRRARTSVTRGATVLRSITGPPKLATDCMVTIGDRVDPLFKGDFELMGQVAGELKLKKYDATSAFDLETKIDIARRAGCRDALIVIAAHGFPMTGTKFHATDKAGNDYVVPGSDHASVQIKHSYGKDPSGQDMVSAENLDAVALRQIMDHFRQFGMSFKLVVSACFSGRWRELGDVKNLRFIGTAARNDQFGIGYMAPATADGTKYAYPKGHQSQGVFTPTGGTIQNDTTNTTHATEFMNGILHGLDFWAHSEPDRAKTGDDLAKGLVVAFHHEHENDFAAQTGDTTPVDEEHVDRTGTPESPHPVASFTFTPNAPPSSPKVGQQIFFDGRASTPSLVELLWNFGDGTTSTGFAPRHAYAHPGIYDVELTATDLAGRKDFDGHQVFVSGPGTKMAALNDVPCPDAMHPITVFVDIRIPSYAQNPAAAITVAPTCPGATTSNFQYTLVPDNDLPPGDPEGEDEWHRRKNHLHVTFTISGNSGPNVIGSVTVAANWN